MGGGSARFSSKDGVFLQRWGFRAGAGPRPRLRAERSEAVPAVPPPPPPARPAALPPAAWRGPPRSPPAWKPCWGAAATPTASSRSWSRWRCGVGRRRGAGPRRAALPAPSLSNALFLRAGRRRRCSAPRGPAAGSSGRCCGGGSCSWARCPPRRPRWPVSAGRPGRGGPPSAGGGSAARSFPDPFGAFGPSGTGSAEEKYKAWMRHRYRDCVGGLAELMGHPAFRVKVGPGPAAGMRDRGSAALRRRLPR